MYILYTDHSCSQRVKRSSYDVLLLVAIKQSRSVKMEKQGMQ